MRIKVLTVQCTPIALIKFLYPIETITGYRQYIVTHIPQLQTVDFSGVTKADRKVSDVWVKMMIAKEVEWKLKMTME